MAERQKPLIACKVRVADLINGRWIERMQEPSAISLADGREVSRANVIGIVVDKSESEPPGLVIDDGSERIPIRAFEHVPGIDEVELGMPVLIVGRPRQFGGERFLVPECVRQLESAQWIDLRKRELGEGSVPMQDDAHQLVIEDEPQKKPLIDAIRALDSGPGADIDEALANAQCDQSEMERLLATGEIFQVSPGRIKILE